MRLDTLSRVLECVGVGLLVGACAAGLTPEEKQFRDEYIVDEQACVAKVKMHVFTKAEGLDCICKVMARRGRVCEVGDAGK